jgi:hypothetical protein
MTRFFLCHGFLDVTVFLMTQPKLPATVQQSDEEAETTASPHEVADSQVAAATNSTSSTAAAPSSTAGPPSSTSSPASSTRLAKLHLGQKKFRTNSQNFSQKVFGQIVTSVKFPVKLT